MAIPLTPQADEAWIEIRKTLVELHLQLSSMRGKCVAKTINSSDLLSGLWAALPSWERRIDAATVGVSATAIQSFVRTISGDNTLDLIGDWQSLKIDMGNLISAIRSDANLFIQSGPDAGTENNTFEAGPNNTRVPKIYNSGEMDYLIPLIDACLTHFA